VRLYAFACRYSPRGHPGIAIRPRSIRVDHIETLCEDRHSDCDSNIEINKCLDDAEGMKQVCS